ncbi:MAG TPA: hypothetical protein PLL94_09010 [Bacteroidales bacterium]|jgi:DNA-binding phage protein|nr:MAG: hypothetical protein BWX96_02410 [Bacteroidetes bacterium ADurb.Bin145]HQK68274.1 hypothetical protein [Bacteroidales bacterium]
MGKIDLGEVKTTTRIRNGVEQVIRLFNKKQRRIIIEAVESRPEEMTIEDVLKVYDVSPAVYYSWLRNAPEEKTKVENVVPNPLEETFKNNTFASASQLREFYDATKPELKEFIMNKFEEWEKNDLISQILKKLTAENMSEVAKAGGISVEELQSFVQRKNKDLKYYSVEGIRRYLQI